MASNNCVRAPPLPCMNPCTHPPTPPTPHFSARLIFSARSAPPRLQDCSPTGPAARHMAVEAAQTDIDLGYYDWCAGGSHQASGVARGSTAAAAAAAPTVLATGDEQGCLSHPLLREPVHVAVTVKSVYPTPPSAPTLPGGVAPAADCDGGHGLTQESADGSTTTTTTTGSGVRIMRSSGDDAPGPSSGSGATAVNLPAEEGPVWRPARGDGDQSDTSPDSARAAGGGGGGEEAEQERKMQVRVELPRMLRLSLTPDARAALTGCIGGNVLAVGFHGEIFENFPLLASPSSLSSLEGGVGVVRRSGGDAEGEDDKEGEREEREAECIEYEKEGRGRAEPRRAEGGSPKRRSREMLRGGLGSGGGRGGANPSFRSAGTVQQQQQQLPSPAPSSSGTAIGSRGEGEGAPVLPLACPVCADSFDELLARHECSWCKRMVCRKCMHTQVGWMNSCEVG